MLNKREYEKMTWIDLTSPTNDEVKKLIDEHGIHHRVAEEILSPTLKPKFEVYGDVIYLILHFPAIAHTHSNEKNQEVDFIIGKRELITIHYDTVDSIKTFADQFEIGSLLNFGKNHKNLHAGFIFYNLIITLYDSIQSEIDLIESNLVSIEDKVFSGSERMMVEELSKVSRTLLDMEQTIEGHERALKSLFGEGEKIFGNTFTQELRDILHEYNVIYSRIRDQREFLAELRTTNDSLLSSKQNEVMKTLTIMAFVTFPLSLVASIFGMNTTFLPIVGSQGDFWIIVGIMIGLTILMFAYFKHKKWL